jgi:hypothetical protein
MIIKSNNISPFNIKIELVLCKDISYGETLQQTLATECDISLWLSGSRKKGKKDYSTKNVFFFSFSVQ